MGPAGLQRGCDDGKRGRRRERLCYDAEGLKDAIKDAKASPVSIQLLIKRGDQYRTMAVKYHGGLRYSHLERIPSTPALLDDVLSPR